MEKLTDVLEVLTAIAAGHGGTVDNIVGITRSKRAERGGFRYAALAGRRRARKPMTITPTESPRLANRAERRVYQALTEQLQPTTSSLP